MLPTNRNYTTFRTKDVTQTVSFMSRVYLWMMAGILISGFTAFYIASEPQLIRHIVENNAIFIGLIIAQLVAVVALSAWVQRMSVGLAATVYALYATLVGATFSTIFLAYTMESISLVFFSTAFAFGGLSAFGYITKRDLGPIGSFCMIGLFGVIGIVLLSLFIPSLNTNAMQLTIASLGVLVFAGLTAYDTQRIKALQYQFASVDEAQKGAIHGALILYLDFINLFLNLLRLMGDRR